MIARNDETLAHGIARFQIDERLHASYLKSLRALEANSYPIDIKNIINPIKLALKDYILLNDQWTDNNGLPINLFSFMTPVEELMSYKVFNAYYSDISFSVLLAEQPILISSHLVARIYQRAENLGTIDKVPRRIRNHFFLIQHALDKLFPEAYDDFQFNALIPDGINIQTFDTLGGKVIWESINGVMVGKTFVDESLLRKDELKIVDGARMFASKEEKDPDPEWTEVGGTYLIEIND